MAADGRMKRMTKESERRKREGEEVGEVTDEESVELWLVGGEKKGEEYTEWQQRGNSSRNSAFINEAMAGCG